MTAAMDGPARLPALGAAAADCVQSHRDDEVIVVLHGRRATGRFALHQSITTPGRQAPRRSVGRPAG